MTKARKLISSRAHGKCLLPETAPAWDNSKQEVSSKRIIVEANRALRSLKKERDPNDLRQGRNDSGVKCHTNLDQKDKDGTEMTGQNYQGSKMALGVLVNRDAALARHSQTSAALKIRS